MKGKQKGYVLGIDGATFRIIAPLIKEGSLPNFERVMKEGVYGTLRSTIPPLSGPAWTSFMTGMEPSNHGIFDFVLKKPNSYKTYYANFRHIKGETFWNILGNYGKKVIIQNIMVTYPPSPVNGYLITGGLTPSGRDYTYPKSLANEIESKFGKYPHLPVGGINVAKDGERKYIEIFYKNMEKRAEITKYLMKKKPWDLFVVMFEAADSLQHEFWKYIDNQHPRYEIIEDEFIRDAIPNFYKKMDEFLGELLNELDDHTTLFIMSDHGFGRLKKYIVVNNFLINIGMLKLKRGIKTKVKKFIYDHNIDLKTLYDLSKKRGFTSIASKFRGGKTEDTLNKLFLSVEDIDWSRTKAFSVGTGGHIYINLQGKEPEGVVDSNDYESIVYEIVEELKDFVDPETGEKVVEVVYTKTDVCNGKFSDLAPDISFIPKEGYATLHREQFVSSSLFIESPNSGYHRRDGIFIAYGYGVVKSRMKKADIFDIAPTILHLFGLPIPKEMDGRVLKETFEDDSELAKKEIVYQVDYERKHLKEKVANLRKLGKI
ncbi:MAG: alkaline phosphatase family protein [Methanophagales archaeon]|nr:alkaline phosphatase family protein [Methanophagales archaeon]